LTNSVASPVGDAARSRTVGAPTMSIDFSTGAETKVANWPGMSPATPSSRLVSRPPMPGSEDRAPGLPFGGLAICWASPLTWTSMLPVPVRPG
jgi:hypothetical protein